MDSVTNIKRPEWLTDSEIERLKSNLLKCSNPYTEEEMQNIELDGFMDMERYHAYVAKDVLTKYRLL